MTGPPGRREAGRRRARTRAERRGRGAASSSRSASVGGSRSAGGADRARRCGAWIRAGTRAPEPDAEAPALDGRVALRAAWPTISPSRPPPLRPRPAPPRRAAGIARRSRPAAVEGGRVTGIAAADTAPARSARRRLRQTEPTAPCSRSTCVPGPPVDARLDGLQLRANDGVAGSRSASAGSSAWVASPSPAVTTRSTIVQLATEGGSAGASASAMSTRQASCGRFACGSGGSHLRARAGTVAGWYAPTAPSGQLLGSRTIRGLGPITGPSSRASRGRRSSIAPACRRVSTTGVRFDRREPRRASSSPPARAQPSACTRSPPVAPASTRAWRSG